MSANRPTPSQSPADEITLLLVGGFALAAVLGSAGALWLKGTQWLVDQGVLVAAAADPLWEIPGTGGAGLDLLRLFVLVGVAGVATAVLVSSLWRAVQRRREAEAQQ